MNINKPLNRGCFLWSNHWLSRFWLGIRKFCQGRDLGQRRCGGGAAAGARSWDRSAWPATEWAAEGTNCGLRWGRKQSGGEGRREWAGPKKAQKELGDRSWRRAWWDCAVVDDQERSSCWWGLETASGSVVSWEWRRSKVDGGRMKNRGEGGRRRRRRRRCWGRAWRSGNRKDRNALLGFGVRMVLESDRSSQQKVEWLIDWMFKFLDSLRMSCGFYLPLLEWMYKVSENFYFIPFFVYDYVDLGLFHFKVLLMYLFKKKKVLLM